MPARRADWDDVVAREDVVAEGRDIRLDAGSRDGAEMDDGVEPVVTVVDRAEGVRDLTRIREVDAGEPRPPLPREIERDDIVTCSPQLTLDDRAELAGCPGYGDPHVQAGGA